MELNKQNYAIAVAGITLGNMLHEANTLAEDTGTLVRLIEHEASRSATEVCLVLEEHKLIEIVLRDHDKPRCGWLIACYTARGRCARKFRNPTFFISYRPVHRASSRRDEARSFKRSYCGAYHDWRRTR